MPTKKMKDTTQSFKGPITTTNKDLLVSGSNALSFKNSPRARIQTAKATSPVGTIYNEQVNFPTSSSPLLRPQKSEKLTVMNVNKSLKQIPPEPQ